MEGVVASPPGMAASSIALVGFGLDSAVEGFAIADDHVALHGAPDVLHAAETRAQKLVAIQFFLLAPYVGIESCGALLGGERPTRAWVGIALAASVGRRDADARHRQAAARRSNRLGRHEGRGRQNMLCAYLAGALLLGLLGNMVVGAWWLDPRVGLLIAGVAVKEGLEAWRGEGCCR